MWIRTSGPGSKAEVQADVNLAYLRRTPPSTYIGAIFRIMEKKMEATIVYWGYIGVENYYILGGSPHPVIVV